MIERGSGVAVWRQIENELADAIAQGSLAAGERLPNEMQLAEQFAVNQAGVAAVFLDSWDPTVLPKPELLDDALSAFQTAR